MEKTSNHLIVTGPESSGKTTLCQGLAHHFNTSFTEEYARTYLEKRQGRYSRQDLLPIAMGQLQKEKNNSNSLAIHDTDLLTIKIWSEYKYSFCDPWIKQQIEKQKEQNRLYLLCKADIPWQADPLREHPNNRTELFNIYLKELHKLDLNYHIIEGKDRLQGALLKIHSFLKEL